MDERGLWAGVLIQAVKDLAGYGRVYKQRERARVQYHARLWFTSDNRDVGSFLWICDELELEPSWIRRKMFALINSNQVGRDGAGRCSLLRLQGLFGGADDYAMNRVSDLLSA
jgi:hypothetical protein